jgi:F-type H+-transporting ATPase subunit b
MKKIVCVMLVALPILLGSTSFAQEEPAKERETHHEETPFAIIARWANFAVLFGGLAYLLRKPMQDFFQTRRTDIASGLQRAQDEQASARARMDEIEQRLAHLAADVAALRSEAESESLAERERILAEAKREVERVVEQSRQEIERIARTIERQVKESITEQVIDRAGTTLRTEMTQDDQKRVIVRFIQNL